MPENENQHDPEGYSPIFVGQESGQSPLVAEYEWLRQLAKVLDEQSNYVEARLVEIERQLPDAYKFTDDALDERYMLDERR